MLQRAGLLGCCLVALAGCVTSSSLPRLAPPTSGVPPMRTGGVYHRVESGQTLWRIAQEYNLSLDALVEANRLENPQRISAGQLVWIPGGSAVRRVLGGSTPGEIDDRSGFQWPVRGDVISPFGAVQGGSTNRGIDIRATPGTPVRAARGGRVVFVDAALPGYGKTIMIDHGDGLLTVYAWHDEILVQLGQTVSRGTPIATVGASGRATAGAVHFEIRRRHVPQNPFYYLP